MIDRPAGAYVLTQDGQLVPDMNDEAMRNREQRTEDRRQKTEDRERRTENGGPRTKNKGPRTKDKKTTYRRI